MDATDGAVVDPADDPADGRARRDGGDDDREGLLGAAAVEAAGIGTFDWEVATGRLLWNRRMLQIAGFDETTFDQRIETFERIVHPDDLPTVRAVLGTALASGGDLEVEYRVVTAAGEPRWFTARGRALLGPDGTAQRVVGAAFDSTLRRDGEAQVARVLETMPTAFYSLDRDWRFTYVNARAEKLLGRTREDLLGGVVWDLFPAAPGSPFEEQYRRAVATGQEVAFDAWYPEPLLAWFQVRAWPNPAGLSVYFSDVTERRRTEEAVVRAAQRARLTAEVSARLGETLEAEEAVARLAHLVVPALADWCVVTLVEDHGDVASRRDLRDVGSWHRDPAMRPVAERYAATRLAALEDRSFLLRALEEGRAVQVARPAHTEVARVLRPGEARDLLARLAPEGGAVVPMRARGRTLGALSLFIGPERAPFDDEDLRTATEVAGRAGLALDNARLYREQRHLAEALQRAMLTDPPEPDHVEVVVRYEPAAVAARVGGDWYDAFLQADGRTVLVVGDVAGHDMDAAAAMGQLRSVLRGIGVATGAGPAELLTLVDRGMRTLQSSTIATAVVARVEQEREERAAGLCRLRWSNAGHPSPLVLHPDGTVETLATARNDPLLGVVPECSRTEHVAVLRRGATVLLYTDGLVERRDRSVRAGMDELRAVLAEVGAGDPPLQALCDEVVRRMLPERPADDVALVGVRLHRQDVPRPPEAGPGGVPPGLPPDPEVAVRGATP
ncbi:SpoIIE family protein phosphatase [Cellulomonas marina]|uniref:PAS domain S-box-containing protein n=1 Tax=Cellulomonas marina TaxID=988821 RepID=A0A1I1AI33_9CELL|nr:SpoIIE family protein phosphatase [Cellulomonas marina]GIG29704.1 hypothetical protein Cma02nite_23040 [Cellulomonas marina]SFB36110.1 PAS domain S-box-containing protein [Cellulomonas marina]